MKNLAYSHEEVLTTLISALINWVDDEMPGALDYGDISLKQGMERYFYFSAVHQPELLKPLLSAASGWRLSTPRSFVTDLHDEILVAGGHLAWLARAKGFLKTILRICKFIWNRRSVQPPADVLSRIGLFAINARFVRFFAEYAQALGKEKILFFCTTVEAASVAASMGYAVATESAENIDIRKVKLPVLSALFPAYCAVLQTYLRVHGTMANYQPATMVFAEGTSMEDQVAGLAARMDRIPTVRLQSGRGGILHSGYRNMAFDKMLCWGNGFVKRYQQHTPKAEYIITGNPSLPISNERKTLNPSHVTCVIFTQPVNKFLSTTHYEILVMLTRRLLSQHEGMRVLVRKHPVDKCESFDLLATDYPDKIVLADYRTWSLKRVMESADITVGFYSTTLSESAACGVIPFILKLEDAHSVFPFPEQHGAAIEVSDVEAALVAIESLLNDPVKQAVIRQNMARFTTEFFGPQDGKAMQRIIHCLLETSGIH